MTHMPGVSGYFSELLVMLESTCCLFHKGVTKNISTVVHAHDATRALRAVHAAFVSLPYLSIGITAQAVLDRP